MSILVRPQDVNIAIYDPKERTGKETWRRGIYQQSYGSPRPETCSAQLGTDGFSPWTYTYWNIKPPTLEFSMLIRG